MIPVKLRLYNFMCYRDNVPPLSFDGIHTACICGDNGSGKSALIDAMTWALWGRTRARSDDDLIHTGQTEMEVEFDFTVGQQTYRIIRKHAKPKQRRRSGQTILEFQIATGNGFRSIAGDSLTQTQQKIIDVLHMDYTTFINSALLLQGHADEFTIKRPVERKQVLSDILGLAFYDELEEQAKDLAKQRETEKAQLQSTIEEISGELAQKPAYEAELDQVQYQLSQIEKVVQEQESKLKELRQKKEELESERLQLAQLEEHMTETERGLERWNNQLQQHRSRLQEYEALMGRRSTIEADYTRFLEVKKLNDELERKFRQSVSLERQKTLLDSKIREAGQSLLTEHAIAQNKIGELETGSQRLPQLRNELQQVQLQWRQLDEAEKALGNKRRSCQEGQAQVHHLESDKARLEKEIAGIEEKLKLLLSQTEARCPLCETELGENGLSLIEAKYAAERESKANSLRSNQTELASRKIELVSLEEEISQLEAKLNRDRVVVQSKAALLDKAIAEAEEAGNKLVEERERLAEIEQRLAKRDFAPIERQMLGELEDELARLDYNLQQHEQIRQRLASLEQYENLKRELEEADRLSSQEKEAASRAEEALQELRHNLEVEQEKQHNLTQKLSLLPQLVSDLTQSEAEHQRLIARQKESQEILWRVKAKLHQYSELEAKRVEKAKLLNEASKQEEIYRDLAQAFGKKGIQALLIEWALPEIENEANRLLGRMTDNRMSVKIETQRETRKGELQETLDINIADELGTRNYEMFSGGEAFRINFAIRIALSKLLAKRAGAPLPTLVIDEGFGSQDSTGIEKLKEAIISIQDDFEKILVTTHIEELRDAFPTRIDVIKTAEGSTVEIR